MKYFQLENHYPKHIKYVDPLMLNTIANQAAELSCEDYTEQQIESAITHVFGVDTTLIADQTYFVIEKDGEVAGCGGKPNDSHLNPASKADTSSKPSRF